MTQPQKCQEMQTDFSKKIGESAERRQRARREKRHPLWFGLGAMGMVGWSVGLPTLLGVLLGLWLDAHWPHASISWTLTFLMVGLAIGCLGAWQWVRQEVDKMKREEKNNE
ncbi:MAG: AtpZ/AtpI family protein [Anaerolineae bacterium]|nr:AtpZ/AtpI family protein [Anaerolineae bacterium]